MRIFIRGFKKGFSAHGKNLALLVSSLMLSFVYVFGIGMTAMFAKITKKKLIDVGPGKKKSYWAKIRLSTERLDNYYKQF